MKRTDQSTRLTKIARDLRTDSTFPERLVWSRLRRGRLGARFRRQQPIGRFVVDFYCPEWNLVVEIDGRSHGERTTRAEDVRRQTWLEDEGYDVIRFTNDEVLDDLDRLIELIRQVGLRMNAP